MIILYNANIYTTGQSNFRPTALAIQGEKIIACGLDSEMLGQFGNHAHQIDLRGKTIWPGLTDCHLHLMHLSQSLTSVNCETPSLQMCLDEVAHKAGTLPAGSWIHGHGWNHNIWENASYGTAAQLDAISRDHPVYLTAKSLHASWVNSKALSLAGIDAHIPDPPGGEILRDESGNPTGILLENAVNLVSQIIPTPSADQLAQDLDELQPYLWAIGITSVHDYDSPLVLQALQILKGQDRLHMRVQKNLPVSIMTEAIATGLRSGFGDDMLHIGSLKLFVDGALGPQSAAMLAPYTNSNSLGTLLLEEKEILEIGITAVENGWSLTIHAIGDKANRIVLDALESLREYETAHKLPHFPHRIEHAQLLHPQDQPRLSALGITASMQPIHCTSDMLMVERYWGNRAAHAYPFRSLLDHQTQLVFGSDAPVESSNPFHGIHAAVTRRRQDGLPGTHGWLPEQRISLNEALACYTCTPAVLSGLGNRLGKMKPGYLADLIVLPEDPFSLAPHDLFSIQPEMTMVNGMIVYQK